MQTQNVREFTVKEHVDDNLEDGHNTSIDIFKIKPNYF